ncbi:AAA family ATPase [Paracidobacterium acidisoli]|uniref:Cytidylate kinase-like family protein n=1 Tax=Paracidobacterium acidisoli TaxID=2303751 RepID=A0A372IP82_9BACT|nr:cytidylate kinase-like family protein [Paracidobacterium acidisoli]MBT9331857.1 cytidylate kinase-like family protein [Paracidobacterium acidisoli]
MVRIITVEREYGSRGAEYAHHLAKHLGWKLIDYCLIEEVARKAGVSPSLAKQCDERLDPWYYRFGKAFWLGSLDRMAKGEADVFDSERMVEFVRDYLIQEAAEGNRVVVGRGAACVLSRTPGAFHVFVYASKARKVQWFEEHFPEHARDAERDIQMTDRRRAEYVRRFHQQEWTDRRLYHLMMNSCMGFDSMIRATVDAAGLGMSMGVGEAAAR